MKGKQSVRALTDRHVTVEGRRKAMENCNVNQDANEGDGCRSGGSGEEGVSKRRR